MPDRQGPEASAEFPGRLDSGLHSQPCEDRARRLRHDLDARRRGVRCGLAVVRRAAGPLRCRVLRRFYPRDGYGRIPGTAACANPAGSEPATSSGTHTRRRRGDSAVRTQRTGDRGEGHLRTADPARRLETPDRQRPEPPCGSGKGTARRMACGARAGGANGLEMQPRRARNLRCRPTASDEPIRRQFIGRGSDSRGRASGDRTPSPAGRRGARPGGVAKLRSFSFQGASPAMRFDPSRAGRSTIVHRRRCVEQSRQTAKNMPICTAHFAIFVNCQRSTRPENGTHPVTDRNPRSAWVKSGALHPWAQPPTGTARVSNLGGAYA